MVLGGWFWGEVPGRKIWMEGSWGDGSDETVLVGRSFGMVLGSDDEVPRGQ